MPLSYDARRVFSLFSMKYMGSCPLNRKRINSYNKTAFSSDDSLDPGPEPPAGLRHGVSAEGPHHLPDLRDQGLGLVMRLCSDTQFRDATRKIVQTAAFSGAGRSDILLPHLHEVLLEPTLRLLAVVGRGACALCEGLFVLQSLSCSHKLSLSADPQEAINLFKLPCIIVNWVLIEVSIVSFSVHPSQSPETIPALVAPC